MGSAPSVPQTSIHEFTVKDSKGKDVDLSNYKGKVLLVVNVASKCGFTNSNYTQLTELYSKYKDKGFEILAFPCNQFLKQEPGTSEEAEQFACTRFKAEYPIFSKGYEGLLNYMGQIVLIDFAFVSFYNMDSTVQVRVNGPTAAPVYKFLKASKGSWFGSSIKWNFTKFLVDKEGRVIRRYGTSTQPSAIEVVDELNGWDTDPSPSNTKEMHALEKFPSVALYGLPPPN